VQSSKTDPLWVFENYGAAAELIDELEAARAADKARIAELVLSLRTVVGMLHHRATTPLERQAIRIAETALSQQGKEGEC
jgi:hypothetical protein